MSPLLVSVIIPCYRQGRFLAAAVQCVLNQTYSPIEIIVVNDGSDDETESVAQSFGARIRYTWKPNSGLSAARNCGISLARGDYLHFLDADDLLHPDGIRWLVEAAQGHTNPLCLMGNRHFEREADLTGGLTKLPPHGEHLSPMICYKNFGPPHAYLCRRLNALAVGGFDPTVPGCEDWDFWIRLVWSGSRIVPIHHIGAYYRQHPDSMSQNAARMATMKAKVLQRSLRRVTADPDTVVQMGGDLASVTRHVRDALASELLDAGYYLREANHYLSAAHQFRAFVRELGWSRRPVIALCKLLPHKFLRTLHLLAD